MKACSALDFISVYFLNIDLAHLIWIIIYLRLAKAIPIDVWTSDIYYFASPLNAAFQHVDIFYIQIRHKLQTFSFIDAMKR